MERGGPGERRNNDWRTPAEKTTPNGRAGTIYQNNIQWNGNGNQGSWNEPNRRIYENSDGSFTCFRCGMKGHMANKCTNATLNTAAQENINSRQYNQDTRGAAGISGSSYKDHNSPTNTSAVNDSNTLNLSEENYTGFAETANVHILRCSFCSEKTKMEDRPEKRIRLTEQVSSWKPLVSSKNMKGRRPQRRNIRCYQHVIDNLNEAYNTKETSRRGSQHITCFRCGRGGHFATNCNDVPDRQAYREWRKMRRQEVAEERGNHDQQVRATMEVDLLSPNSC